MKVLYCALAASVTLAFLPMLQASARPAESDFFCYMRTPTGRVIDLTVKMCGVVQSSPVANHGLSTGSASPDAGYGTANPADALNYDPRLRSVRTEVRGSVTRTISGGPGDDLSDDRDREIVISPGIGSYGDTYRSNGTCTDASDFARDGSRCGERAASEIRGGRY